MGIGLIRGENIFYLLKDERSYYRNEMTARPPPGSMAGWRKESILTVPRPVVKQTSNMYKGPLKNYVSSEEIESDIA